MIADADINVWLETQARTAPGQIVPYIQSVQAGTFEYRVQAVTEGQHGRSELNQGGSVRLKAEQAAALGRMSFSRQANDRCHINVTVSSKGVQVGKYFFECPT